MDEITLERAKEIIGNAKGKRIAVVGDVMLDRFLWGTVTRISPEAPVPVVDLHSETAHLGGASNVANNLCSFGIDVLLCGVIGNDNSAKIFLELAQEKNINTEGIFISDDRPTIVKTRIIAGSQHVVRVDREEVKPIPDLAQSKIFEFLANQTQLDGIILQDYNKGTLTRELIRKIINFAGRKFIPIFVDPKFENFFEYRGVTVFKPNKKETQQAIGRKLNSFDDYVSACRLINERLNTNAVLLTLGAKGMLLFLGDNDYSHIPTRARKVADVSGAGDTAIATFAAAFVSGGNFIESASIANYAAGVVCEEPGVVAINIDSLLDSIKRNNIARQYR